MSPVKEPHFFNADDKQLISTLERYEELFLEASERHIAVGEASVWYLSSALAIPNILRYQPAARFIVMLRNPLEMAPALHMETVFSGHENILDFLEAWKQQERRRRGGPLPAPDWVRRAFSYGDICSLGAQYKQLLSLVPEDRVLTVLLEDLVDDPRTQYVRTLKFLGLHYDGRLEFPNYNKSKLYRWPWLQQLLFPLGLLKRRLGIERSFHIASKISRINLVEGVRHPLTPDTKALLRDYFREDVALLGGLLHRDLGHWLDEKRGVVTVRSGVTRQASLWARQ